MWFKHEFELWRPPSYVLQMGLLLQIGDSWVRGLLRGEKQAGTRLLNNVLQKKVCHNQATIYLGSENNEVEV